ncbi:MAG TPA: nuclear transport factor 2 family protein, partial [Thermoleophilaceae bacterium]
MHGRQQESDAGAASTGVTDHDLEVVRTGYDLWNAGDVEALAGTCFAEDIEYTNSPEWPGQQTYHGAEAVAR